MQSKDLKVSDGCVGIMSASKGLGLHNNCI